MNSNQDRILKVSMSIAVGIIAFCVTVPIVLVLGGMLFSALGWLNGDGLIPTGFAVLFLIAIFVGVIVGIIVGIRYYRYMQNQVK